MAYADRIAFILLAAMFSALADACYIGQVLETDTAGALPYRWAVSVRDPCACLDPSLGGVNTSPRYTGGIIVGDDAQEGIGNLRRMCSSKEPGSSTPAATPAVTVAMTTCNAVTILLGAHVLTSYFPISLTSSGVWELDFSVAPRVGTDVTKEIIYLYSSSSETSLQYRIEISPNALELYNRQGERITRIYQSPASDWGGRRHNLAIGDGKFYLDSTLYVSLSGLLLDGVQFVRFKSEAGQGAMWVVDNVPCTWQSLDYNN